MLELTHRNQPTILAVMHTSTPLRSLNQDQSRWLWRAGMLLAGSAGGWTLSSSPADRLSDQVLIITGLLALPIPGLLLSQLTLPRSWRLRQMLGEPADATLRSVLNDHSGALVANLAAIVGLTLTMAVCASWDTRAICIVAVGTVGSSLATMGLVCSSMRVIAVGTPAELKRLAGSGFGPPEMAPLLYAPAFGFAAAMVPAALLAALWGAAPQLQSMGLWLGCSAGSLGLLWMVSHRALQTLRPRAQAAFSVIAEAHRSPNAHAEELPQPPGWLVGSTPVEQYLARIWVRRYPASALSTIAMLVITTLNHSETSWTSTVALTAIALYSGLRGAAIGSTSSTLAVLGASSIDLQQGTVALSRRLLWPCLAGLPLMWWMGPTQAIGLGLGVLLAWVIVGRIELKRARTAQLLALAIVFVCNVYS
ncbi:MAG TPA: hypothetical protein DCQ06_10300 [Myxococcales bacterium]|nr:hypothetical protein [Myxococcales bacterium]